MQIYDEIKEVPLTQFLNGLKTSGFDRLLSSIVPSAMPKDVAGEIPVFIATESARRKSVVIIPCLSSGRTFEVEDSSSGSKDLINSIRIAIGRGAVFARNVSGLGDGFIVPKDSNIRLLVSRGVAGEQKLTPSFVKAGIFNHTLCDLILVKRKLVRIISHLDTWSIKKADDVNMGDTRSVKSIGLFVYYADPSVVSRVAILDDATGKIL